MAPNNYTTTYTSTNSYSNTYITTNSYSNNINNAGWTTISIPTLTYALDYYPYFTTVNNPYLYFPTALVETCCYLCHKETMVLFTATDGFVWLCAECSNEMFEAMKLPLPPNSEPRVIEIENEYGQAVEELRKLRCPQCGERHDDV